MKPIVSHISALEYWRSVRFGNRAYRRLSSAQKLLGVPPRANSFDEPGAWWLTEPLHVLVGDDSIRRVSQGVISHIWKGKLPRGSILDTQNGFCICSPELTFVQMATILELSKLIELGFEFCGVYDISEGGVRSCAPLTSVKKLSSFLGQAKGMHGRKNALRALKYIAENSASPRETILTMLLCLPYSLGGYGIALPVLNYRIELDGKANKLAGKSYCLCDLCWPDAQFALEYDSDQFHTGAERIAQDSARRAALASAGITVLSVTNRQLYNSGEFNGVARLVAASTGKRLQYEDPAFTRSCLGLREKFFEERQPF